MNSKCSARVLIADDHRLMAEACKTLLQPEFEVVAIVTDGQALVRTALQLKPEVCIIDISLPQLNGLDAAERIKAKLPSIRLVFLSVNKDPEIAVEAFRRGASGYILKHCRAQEFVTAIQHVVVGRTYLSPLIAHDTLAYLLTRSEDHNPDKQISGRQVEILQLLAEGQSMKQAANILNIKPGTVAFHKYRMMQTLGVTTNAALFEYAMKHHIIAA